MKYVADGLAEKVRVKAAAAFAADDLLTITGDIATAGTGPYKTPKAVKINDVFFAEFVGGGPVIGATVTNGQSVAVVNSASGDSHSASATVTGTTLTNVKFAATVAMVDNADAVVVNNSAGTAVAGTHSATVAAGVLSNVTLAATVAPIVNAAAIVVQNSAGTAVAGTHAATVAAGVLSNVKLAATVAPIVNGAALTVPVTGTYTTTATVTVAAGVVTGIALS